MIQIADLAWMAGVLDLKGRVIIKNNKSRATPQVVLAVQSKEFPVIRRLGMLTGTNPELMTERPVKDFMRKGCDDHCPEAHVHVSHGGYESGFLPPNARWTITGAGMVVVLDNLHPYLQVDRGYQEVIDQLTAETVLQGRGVGMVRKQLDRLKELGWQVPAEFDGIADPVPATPVTKYVTSDEVQTLIYEAMGR